MGSVAEQPKKSCAACAQPTKTDVKYSNDRLCDRCTAVLWAAQALLDNEFKDAQEIIPTVVFAAVSAGDRHLEELKESLAADDLRSERGRLLRQRFTRIFEFHSIWALADGVPIIRQHPIYMAAWYKDGGLKEIERMTIDVVDISPTAKQVAEHYRSTLELYGVDTSSPQQGEEGMIGWQVDPGVIHMAIYPTPADPNRSALVRSLRRRTPRNRSSFPPPAIVEQMYDVLRGSRAKGKFRGFGRSVLPGNLTNKPEAKTLAPACVAWYLAGRKKPSDKGTRIKIAELLNRHLLVPCGLESLSQGGSDFIQLWGNVGKHAEALNSVEQAFIANSRLYGLVANFHSRFGNR